MIRSSMMMFGIGLTMAWMVQSATAQISASTQKGTNVVITDDDDTHIIINGKGVQQWRTSSGATSFDIEMRGKIELTDDDKDIKSISDDGYLEINKTVFGSKRSVVIESLGGGKVKKEYYEGRTKMDWDKNGKPWLSEVLPEIVRSTTIGAETRVARMFKSGGTNAVLGEIDNIESDHVKSEYAKLLMTHPVAAKDYATIVNKVTGSLDSDHYKSVFLEKNIGKFMQNKEATNAVFAATKGIDSDHYRTQIIKEALKGQVASLDNVKTILQAAGEMESDHYITEVLTSLLKQNNLNDAIVSEIINTSKSVESDHYKTVILSKALDKQGLSAASHQRVTEAVKNMESDHYITEVVEHLLKNKLSDELLTQVNDISTSIESDHYRTEVLNTLLSKQELTEAQFTKVLQSAGGMDSDHYKSVVLKNTLSKNLNEGQMVSLLNITSEVDSDHYKSDILITAAPRVKSGSASLKDAYRKAAKSISSDTYYGRVLKAID